MTPLVRKQKLQALLHATLASILLNEVVITSGIIGLIEGELCQRMSDRKVFIMSDYRDVAFPIKISQLLTIFQERYELKPKAALTLLFKLLDIGLINECEKTSRFYENKVRITRLGEQIDQHIKDIINDGFLSPFPGREGELAHDLKQGASISLVYTLPGQIRARSAQKGTEETRRTFREIIVSASESLRIASPYIDQPGLNCLVDAFEIAKERGVRVSLLTRIDERNNPNARQITAIMNLYEILGERFKAKEYSSKIAIGDRYLSYGGVHAKILSADSRLAYLGSGEIRDFSLNRNFELGLICREASFVKSINFYFDLLWEISSAVTYEYCRQYIT